ncbi:murein L,D-transpeptidase [Paracoccus aurantiacus]|uniref:Murein L,D-transpeptidase n=1 Tax=Paracoccus aurantiacus TaxID=2599412 RepID=A0A5C6S4P0_9RHOB|nr:L,D-transpeptidase family protein [Paracoccus aurantiacus]TXB69788.1 murein L,D-transpeptidase [Paracoccus aurantiacus]
MTAPSRLAALAALLLIQPALAFAAPVTPEAIESATYGGGPLPPGQSALTAKAQVMLDRAGTSPGVIDGINGGMSRSAIAAFERRSGLPADGQMDPAVWAALLPFAGGAMITDYTITDADVSELTQHIPNDYLEKANMTSLGYTSVAEKLGERFHMDEKFIGVLNPGVALTAGTTIKVIAPSKPLRAKVARIFIEKATNRVAAYDAEGHMVVNYPATIGSAETPSPSGTHTVRAVAMNPEYTYNPSINFTQGENKSVLTLPPGPNGPVGTVWIALTKPTYGLHGTPTPSRLFVNESHGCVRLTNWDAEELAHMVQPGVTSVEFLEKGTTIADIMGEASGVSKSVQAAASSAASVATQGGAGVAVLASSRAPAPRPADLVAGGAVTQPATVTPAATPAVTTSASPAAPSAATSSGALIPPAAPAATTAPTVVPPAPTVPADGSATDPLSAAVEAATTGADVVVTEPSATTPLLPVPTDGAAATAGN